MAAAGISLSSGFILCNGVLKQWGFEAHFLTKKKKKTVWLDRNFKEDFFVSTELGEIFNAFGVEVTLIQCPFF